VCNAWVQLARLSALWSTAYGRGLSMKLVTLLAIVSLGAVNRYAVLPRLAVEPRRGGVRLFRRVRLALLGPRRPGQAAARARFSRYVTREACLGLVVFALTAFLGQSVPGRHA